MSRLPGLTLEAFLMWAFDLIVDGDASANVSLTLAEAIGTKTRRRHLTAAQFAPIVELFEPERDRIERALANFEPDYRSWRDFAIDTFDWIPDELTRRAREILKAV